MLPQLDDSIQASALPRRRSWLLVAVAALIRAVIVAVVVSALMRLPLSPGWLGILVGATFVVVMLVPWRKGRNLPRDR
jgi:K+ transporter